MLPPEEAAGHDMRHIITNAVGGPRPGVRVEVHKVDLAPGDVLLLCTDGLTEMLPDDDIAVVLREERDPRAACERLVRLANDRGGRDNVTAVERPRGYGRLREASGRGRGPRGSPVVSDQPCGGLTPRGPLGFTARRSPSPPLASASLKLHQL